MSKETEWRWLNDVERIVRGEIMGDDYEELSAKYVNNLESQVSVLREALTAAEWTEHSISLAEDPHCGVCRGTKRYGHAKDCIVGEALHTGGNDG